MDDSYNSFSNILPLLEVDTMNDDPYINSLLCKISDLEAQVSNLQSLLLVKHQNQLRIIRDLTDALVIAGEM